MEPTTPRNTASQAALAQPHLAAEQALAEAAQPGTRLDLSRMEPPRRLAEARLEEVTIDGICGVY